jgi:hypothetical protein
MVPMNPFTFVETISGYCTVIFRRIAFGSARFRSSAVVML